MTLNHTRMLAVAAVLAGFAVAFPIGSQAAVEPAPGGPDGAEAPRFVPGEVLVRFRPAVDGGERAEVRSDENVDFEESLPVPGLQRVETEAGTSVGEAVRELEDRPEVAYAQPNFVRQVAAEPGSGETLFEELWGLDNEGQEVSTASGSPSGTADADIDAPEAWDTTTGSEEVVVAVVDSGVDYTHPDLAENIWRDANGNPGRDFCGHRASGTECGSVGDNDPNDENGHGTHVAGTIGADGINGGGLLGVNWDTSLMPVRVADGEGSTTDSLLIKGFTYAVDNGARVVNASFGGKGPAAAEALQDVVRSSHDTLFVVAAGNGTNNTGPGVNNDASPDFLCNIPADNLACVTASDQNDQLADFANFGVRSVDLAAPGVDVLSTVHRTRAALSEDFETDPFADPPGWSTDGEVVSLEGTTQTQWGWTGPSEELATDLAVADSPDGDYQAGTTSDVTSPTVALPNQPRLCTVDYELALDLDLTPGDSLIVEALPAGGAAPVELARYTASATGSRSHVLPPLTGASSVQLRFTLETDAVGTAGGADVDDVAIDCGRYAVLDGTSMAAPHVAGAAALGFAHEASASPTQMKCALMSGADRKRQFAFTTASGGRLNADLTLDRLGSEPAACITAGPPKRGSNDSVTFRFEASQPGTTFRCRVDGGRDFGCGPSLTRDFADGHHTLQVGALSDGGTVDWNDPARAPTYRFLVDTTGPRMGIPGRKLELSGRRIPVRLRCPNRELSGPCSGNLRLQSKGRVKVGGRKRRITLGTRQFSVAPGEARNVTIRVSRRDRRLVERSGKLWVTARAVAFDSLRNAAARSKNLKLSD